MKRPVIDVLNKAFKELKIQMNPQDIEFLLEIPPSIDMGDYAFPCFILSKQLKKSPHEIALEIRGKIGDHPSTDFDDIQTDGAYLNFYLDRKNLARKAVYEIITKRSNYGKLKKGKNKKIVVDFSSPNIAKPFGIGHLRSTIIGNSVANICEFMGYKTIKINYLGDWGTQFGKLLLGYEKWGSEKKLYANPMKHMLELYVKANNKSYESKSREYLKKLEDKNQESVMLWRVFRELSINDFERMYKKLKIKFDKIDSESGQVKKTNEIIEELKSKNLLKKSQGAYVVDLKKYNLGVALIQKTDGTTLYTTRDLVAAINRYKNYKFDKMIYEVGQEQRLHFKQLFKILDLMGYKWAKDCIHISHGLYLGKNKKKFSTRKGNTILVEDILEKTTKLASKEIKKRYSRISKEELDERAHKVAIAAIFYGDLKNNKSNDIVFDLKKFVSFEGNTGPYILYSYARASSIIRKTKTKEKFKINNLEDKELLLVKKLLQFQEVVEDSFNKLSPALIANYVYQLSRMFNEFYHECPVIGSEEESFRIALVEAFRQITRNSMNLLGIQILEEM